MKSEYPLGTIQNPVKCDGVVGELEYLENLITQDGESVDYERVGSLSLGSGKILDKYSIYNKDGLLLGTFYFNLYFPNYVEEQIIEGFISKESLSNSEYFQDINYLIEKEKELLEKIGESLPHNFVYIWSKAGTLLVKGPYIYAIEDAFGYPKMEMDLKDIKDLSQQIVHELRGISPSHTLSLKNLDSASDLLLTFHFKILNNQKLKSNIYELYAEHIKSKEKITLYFNKI
jgi:hypothetical protein